MSIGTLIADLIRAGTDPDLVGRVAEALASKEVAPVVLHDEAAERRRAKDRDRKASLRGSPRKSAESAENENDRLSTISSSELPSKNPPKGGQKGSPLPADWTPTEAHLTNAAAKGFSRTFVADQAEAMREWAEANQNRPVAWKSNWDRTFDGWLRRAMTPPNGSLGSRGPPGASREIGRVTVAI
jgi:hypothetical protein